MSYSCGVQTLLLMKHQTINKLTALEHTNAASSTSNGLFFFFFQTKTLALPFFVVISLFFLVSVRMSTCEVDFLGKSLSLLFHLSSSFFFFFFFTFRFTFQRRLWKSDNFFNLKGEHSRSSSAK